MPNWVLFTWLLVAMFGVMKSEEAFFRMHITKGEVATHFTSSQYPKNASVQIVVNRKATVGPGELLLFTGTNQTLPPFPVTTNEVRISIRANPTKPVGYSYEMTKNSTLLDFPYLNLTKAGEFKDSSSFDIFLRCNPGAVGIGEIVFRWVLNYQDGAEKQIDFRLQKICSETPQNTTTNVMSSPVPPGSTYAVGELPVTKEITSTRATLATASQSTPVPTPSATNVRTLSTEIVPSHSVGDEIMSSASVKKSELVTIPTPEAVLTYSSSELESSSVTSTVDVTVSQHLSSSAVVDMGVSASVSTGVSSSSSELTSSSPVTSTGVSSSSSELTSSSPVTSTGVSSSSSELTSSSPVTSTGVSSSSSELTSSSPVTSTGVSSSSSELTSSSPVTSTRVSSSSSSLPVSSQPTPSTSVPHIRVYSSSSSSLPATSSSIPGPTSHASGVSASSSTPPPFPHSPSPSVVPPTRPGGGDHHIFGFDERSIWFFVIIGSIVGGGLLIILCLLVVLLCVCCCYKRKRAAKKARKGDKKSSGSKWEGPHRAEFISPLTPPSLWTTLHWGNTHGLPEKLHQTIMDYGMNRNMVAIHNTLKTGTYTCILRGRLLLDKINQDNPANAQLRIKMLAGFTEEGANRKEEVAQFLEQATLTKGLEHNNILKLIGLCAEDGYVPLVLYPYCEHGNMQSFLEKCRLSILTDGRQMVTVQHQLTFCLQIAEGMYFLYQNGIVHPDLALRNCYMDANFTVKISDGALTPDLYPDLYHKVYGVKRPVRWSALETLTQGICGSKSNVWTFGITCVETFTLGELPYSSVRNRNILAHVLMGNRPVRPTSCPPDVYDLLAECWLEMTQYRPGFAELVQRLQLIVKDFTVREAAEIDGIIEDLNHYTGPYMSPPSEKKMLAQPYHRPSGSASTISESDLPQDEEEIVDKETPQMVDPGNQSLNSGRWKSDTPTPQPTSGPVFTFRERHLTNTSTFSNDSNRSHPPPMLTRSREGSFRRSPVPSPLPTPRTPIPVRVPVPPIAVHSESALTHTQSVSSGRSSTDVSSASQKQLLPKEQQESTLEKKKSDSKSRLSDPFLGMNISLGEDLEDDFMAAFDTVLTKHTK